MGLAFEIGPREVVVFYVTHEQFARFSRELPLIREQTYWVHDYVRVSKVTSFECIRFIQNEIIESPYFSADHMETRLFGNLLQT